MTRLALPFALAGLFALPLAAADKDVPKHLADARALVKALDLSNTKYEHGEGSITWTGTVKAECDCSGLVNHLLEHSYGYTGDDLKKWFGAKRPTARRYHDTFSEGKAKAWAKVASLKDAKPGDVIAVKYAEAEKGENTGHVMLIDAAPERQKDAPKGVDGATAEWHVTVIDSTSSPHGPHDTRNVKDGVRHTGVGRGVIRIYTGKDDAVIGYNWSTEGKKLFEQKTHDLIIGRLVRD